MSPGLGLGPGSATGHCTTCGRGSPGSPETISKLSILIFSNRHIFYLQFKNEGISRIFKDRMA